MACLRLLVVQEEASFSWYLEATITCKWRTKEVKSSNLQFVVWRGKKKIQLPKLGAAYNSSIQEASTGELWFWGQAGLRCWDQRKSWVHVYCWHRHSLRPMEVAKPSWVRLSMDISFGPCLSLVYKWLNSLCEKYQVQLHLPGLFTAQEYSSRETSHQD